MNRSESIIKISQALVKAQAAMGGAVKDSKNPFFKSTYATLNSIREATMPHLNANGITVLQPMKIVDGRTVIETVLLHESGEFLSSDTPVVVAKQNDPQAEGSGQSYARRYGMQSLLNIGAVDDDAEAGMGRGATNATPKATVATVAAAPTATQVVSPAVAAEPKKASSFKKPAKAAETTTTTVEGWE